MTQIPDQDLATIEKAIQHAKEMRAKHTAEVCGPALKTVGGFALVVVFIPWHAIRHSPFAGCSGFMIGA